MHIPLLAWTGILALFIGAFCGSHVAVYRALWLIVTKCLGCDQTLIDAAYAKGVQSENDRWEAKFMLPPSSPEAVKLNGEGAR